MSEFDASIDHRPGVGRFGAVTGPDRFVPIAVLRAGVAVKSGTGYSASGDVPVSGSPFVGRVYRDTEISYDYEESTAGRTQLDELVRVSFRYADNGGSALDVRVGDVCVAERGVYAGERLLVKRVREYPSGVQVDCEGGAAS